MPLGSLLLKRQMTLASSLSMYIYNIVPLTELNNNPNTCTLEVNAVSLLGCDQPEPVVVTRLQADSIDFMHVFALSMASEAQMRQQRLSASAVHTQSLPRACQTVALPYQSVCSSARASPTPGCELHAEHFDLTASHHIQQLQNTCGCTSFWLGE